ncbi:peptidylprolyl isomerase [bacterium]|nr:peptidylprolyl isomerase [bacterium]
MMSSLRRNTAVVLWILVFAFIGTIIFSWGMGGFSGPMKPGVVGKIGDQEVTRDQYEQTIQDRFAQERQRYENGDIPESRAEQLRGEAWDALINEVLLNRAEREAGIVVSDAEVAMTIRHSPPPQVANNPNFRDSTGAFDWALYNQVISDPNNIDFLLSLENSTRLQLVRQKIMGRLGSVIHISEEDLKREYIRQNETAEASYVLVDLRNVDVDSSLVTDADLRQAYQKNIDEYQLDARRTAKAARIPNEPTREDTVTAQRLAESLLRRAQDGESFETLAQEYSDDPSAEQGGDLGWFGKGRMVPMFEKAAFNAENGEIVGPVLTQFGWHVIQRLDSRYNEEIEGEEIHARHILINIVQSPESIESLRNLAQSFQEEASENGFERAADLYELDIDTLEIRDNGIVPGLGRNGAATAFMMNRPLGEITPVYEFNRAWVVLKTTEEIPASVTPLEEVKDQLLPDLLKPHQYELAKQEADRMYARLPELDWDLQKLADSEALVTFQESRRPFKANQFISSVGRDHMFAYVAFNMEVGEVSKPFKGEKGYYIIHLDSLTPADMSQFEASRNELYSQVAQKMQNNLFTEWIEQEREDLKIKDYRYLYYSTY